MIQISHAIDLRISSTDSERAFDLVRDADDSSLRVSSTRFDAYASGSLYLPGDGTPVLLGQGGIQSVRGLYVEVAGGTAKAWFNQTDVDSTTGGALLVRPATPGALAHLYLDAEVDSVYLASADGATLQGYYTLWGLNRTQNG